jgi:hypothetical protein
MQICAQGRTLFGDSYSALRPPAGDNSNPATNALRSAIAIRINAKDAHARRLRLDKETVLEDVSGLVNGLGRSAAGPVSCGDERARVPRVRALIGALKKTSLTLFLSMTPSERRLVRVEMPGQ